MTRWDEDSHPNPPLDGVLGCLRILVRLLALMFVIYGLLIIFLVIRLFEWPWGRPVSPSITQFVCRLSLMIIGVRLKVKGQRMTSHGVMVSNHVSWLDIFVNNSQQRIIFVAKTEVSKWFGIAILAKATGTIFIKREPRQAAKQRQVIVQRLLRGQKLFLFPEGTSTDGLRVLKFKPTLFAAFFAPELKDNLQIQPITLCYKAPPNQHPAFYGFWGDETFVASLLKILSAQGKGSVDYIYHPPIRIADFSDRKELALACETQIRNAMVVNKAMETPMSNLEGL